jgi:hypothetical protein
MNLQDLNTFNCQCENALIDKPFHDHVVTWLKEYENIFYRADEIINISKITIGENNNTAFIISFYKEYKTSSTH